MNIIHFKNKIFLVALLVGLAPVPALAARIYLDTASSSIGVGDTVVVNVKIDSENELVNVIDGSIRLDAGFSLVEVKELSVAGSILTVWPHKPTLSSDKKSISFVAGIPGGINSPNATLFKIILDARQTGTLRLKPNQMAVYLNDGKGTLAPTQSIPLEISIHKAMAGAAPRNDWASTISSDTTSPEPFMVVMGRDASVFEGKQFIAFNASDADSGIDHYLVAEGDLPVAESGDNYVLKNQDTPETIIVTAYDKAGNSRVVTYHTPSAVPEQVIIIIFIVIILLVGGVYWYSRFGKKRFKK